LTHFCRHLGITEQVKGKTKPNPANRVPEVVADGEVELAIHATPSLVSAKGVQLVGLLPAELQNWFVNTAGIGSAAKEPDAAKTLIKHLTTSEAAGVIKEKGMEPLGR
jgi:molybdate transport system substrate-binding protein